MNQSADTFNLQRFIEAQDPVYDRVIQELREGCKRSHWMWYIFPQVQGLGHSPTSQRFGIVSADEANAYWLHPILGPRLKECTQLVVDIEKRTAKEIFGYPDYLKFQSCLTLFEQSVKDEPVFHTALLKYYGGLSDENTLAILNKQAGN